MDQKQFVKHSWLSVFSKELETSNPYRPEVSYQSTAIKKKRNHIKNFGIYNRIIWFYEAPVVRFYYNYVSVFLLLYSTIPNRLLSFHSVSRYSSSYFWYYSVMFFLSTIFHWIFTAKTDPVFEICRFQSQKLFCTYLFGVWLSMKSTRSVFFLLRINISIHHVYIYY
jgi:hypothetical protein